MDFMKFSRKPYILAITAILALPSLQSCLSNDNANLDYSDLEPSAIVTVKPVVSEEGDYFYFQLNDREKLWPVDNSVLPYDGKEVRAFVKYDETDMPSDVDPDIYAKAVKVQWMDSILTKKTVACRPDDDKYEISGKYGSDPVEIVADWVTIAEDGYLTLRFRTVWNDPGRKHFVNLISTENPDDPYEVEFRHNAYGDAYGQQTGDGLVAFRLDSLPDTEGKTVKLTLKWQSFTGEKSVQFDYCTRQSTLPDQPEMTSVRSNLNLK